MDWNTGLPSARRDSGLAELKQLNAMGVLWLDGTSVTDAGLVHLNERPSLTSLSLKNTRVSDAGLMRMKGLTRLRCLQLGTTRATDMGVAELQRVPELKIRELTHSHSHTGRRAEKTSISPNRLQLPPSMQLVTRTETPCTVRC